MAHILLLEDDSSLLEGLVYALQKNGFTLTVARTVQEARLLLKKQTFDLLLLDVTLPDGNGFEICLAVRHQGSTVPILFLTAADEETSIIRGLDSGGDDYLTKPFKLGELCSRLRALLRRSGMQQDQLLRSGPVSIDLLGSKAFRDGQPLELTSIEYRLLCLFLQNKGRILTRNVILNILWDGQGNFVDDNTLSVNIRRLREKIEQDPSHPRYLCTVRGFGYQWKEQLQ